jgi:hypothetical protein
MFAIMPIMSIALSARFLNFCSHRILLASFVIVDRGVVAFLFFKIGVCKNISFLSFEVQLS